MNAPENLNALHTKCDTCPIHHRAICKSAEGSGIERLQKLGRTRTIPAGQTILVEDSDIQFVGNVVSGVIKISKTLEDGRQQVVGLLFPSDFFGRPFANTASFSLESASEVELCVFERHSFEKLLHDYPEIEHELLVKVLNELDATREWMVLLGCQSAKERVASFLLMLLRRSTNTGCEHRDLRPSPIIRFPINRKDIAMFLGTTLETISRQIQALSRAEIIRIIDGNTFEILSPHRLAQTAGHEEWLDDFPTSKSLAG
jgi:CRP/FNR family transcriptional regulator